MVIVLWVKLKLRLTGEEGRSCCDRKSVSQARRGKEERREMFVCFAIPKLQMFGPTIGPVKKVCDFCWAYNWACKKVRDLFMSYLPITHAPYVFRVLSFCYLSNGRYKNEKFLKMSFSSRRYNGMMFLRCIRYLNSGQGNFGKIVWRARKWIGWKK
jgi:hypothetical protein